LSDADADLDADAGSNADAGIAARTLLQVLLLGELVDIDAASLARVEGVGGSGEQLGALSPGARAHGALVWQSCQVVPGCGFEQTRTTIGTSSDDMLAVPGGVNVEAGTSVVSVGTQSLPSVGVPRSRRLVLGSCEDEVAVTVVLDGGDATLVTLQQDWQERRVNAGKCTL